MSHMRNVRRRSKVTKRQKKRLTFDILPLCLAPAIRSSLRTISGVLVMLCWVTELLWELIEPLSIASAAILICLSSSAILPIRFQCRRRNVDLQCKKMTHVANICKLYSRNSSNNITISCFFVLCVFYFLFLFPNVFHFKYRKYSRDIAKMNVSNDMSIYILVDQMC